MGAELHPPTFHFGPESLFSSDSGCSPFTPTAITTQDRPHHQPRPSTMPPRRSASARIPSQGTAAAASRDTPSTLGDNVADCITVKPTESQPELPPKRTRKPSMKAVEAAAAVENNAIIGDDEGSNEKKRSTRASRKRSLGSVGSSAPLPTPKRLASATATATGGQSSIYSEAAFSPVSEPPSRATSARPSFLAPPVGLPTPGTQIIPPPPPPLAPPTPATNPLGPQLELATQKITDLETKLAEAEKKLTEAQNTIDALAAERDEAVKAATQSAAQAAAEAATQAANQPANQTPRYLTTMLEEADAKTHALQDQLDALKLRHQRESTEAAEKITTLEQQLAHERQHLEAADRITALEQELAKERQEHADLVTAHKQQLIRERQERTALVIAHEQQLAMERQERAALVTAHTQELAKQRQEHDNTVKELNLEYNRLYDDSVAAGEKVRGHIQTLRVVTDRALVGPPHIPVTQEGARVAEQQVEPGNQQHREEPGNQQHREEPGNQPARPAEGTAAPPPPNPDPSQRPRAPMATLAEALATAAKMALAEIGRNANKG